jgi:hypothetical protein
VAAYGLNDKSLCRLIRFQGDHNSRRCAQGHAEHYQPSTVQTETFGSPIYPCGAFLSQTMCDRPRSFVLDGASFLYQNLVEAQSKADTAAAAVVKASVDATGEGEHQPLVRLLSREENA